MTSIYDALTGAGLQSVQPSTQNWVPLTMFSSVRARSYEKDPARAKLINDVNADINGSRLSSSRNISYQGQHILKEFSTPHNRESQQAITTFEEFADRVLNPRSRNNGLIAFDIETLGDSEMKRSFWSQEVSAVGFERYQKPDGTFGYKQNGVLFNALVSPNKQQKNDMLKLIEGVKRDPRTFRKLTGSQQRSLIDLMRYSSVDAGTGASMINKVATDNYNIQHNRVVDQLLGVDGKIDDSKLVRHFDDYLNHMESGLEVLSNKGDKKAGGVLKRFSKFIRDNSDSYFTSHNGTSFDVPKLQQIAKQLNVDFQGPSKHLDLLRVLQAAYPNMREFHEEFGRIIAAGGAETGLGTLHEITKTILGGASGAAHTGIDDNMNLGAVVDKVHNKINTRIKSAHNSQFDRILQEIRSNVKSDKTFDMVRKKLEKNQASVMAAGTDVEMRAALAKAGIKNIGLVDSIVRINNEIRLDLNFHPTELSWSGLSLQKGDRLFAAGGVMAYGEGALDYQAERGADGKYVVKSPDFNKAVVNSKTFYQVRGLRDISKTVGNDTTTRLALELFDEESGKSSFIVREGAQAYDQIASFVQRRFYNWDGLSNKVREQIQFDKTVDVGRRRYENLFSLAGGGGEGRTRGFESAKRMYGNAQKYLDYKNTPKSNRPIREAFEATLDFNSQFDDKQGWIHNDVEKKAFWRMAPRMMDEAAHYQSAITAIEGKYTEAPSMTKEQLKEIRRKRDVAWSMYANEINKEVGENMVNRPLRKYESRALRFASSKGNDVYINMMTREDAERSIWRILGTKEDGDAARGQRLSNLITDMQYAGVFGTRKESRLAARTLQSLNQGQRVSQSVQDVVGRIWSSSKVSETGDRIPVVSVGRRRTMGTITSQRNAEIIARTLNNADGIQGMLAMQAGDPISVSDGVKSIFAKLDKKHASGLDPRNWNAVEHVLDSLARAGQDQKYGDLHYNMSIAEDGTQVKLNVYRGADSASAGADFVRGLNQTNSGEILIPLINEHGTHVKGNQVLNARTYMVNEGGTTKTLSSAEMIARGYAQGDVMGDFVNSVRHGNFKDANDTTNRALNGEMQMLSGIRRNHSMGLNDTARWLDNQSDFFKQGHVEIAPAMIEKWHKDGNLSIDDIWNEDIIDHYDPKTKELRVSRHATFQDVSGDKAYGMIRKIDDFASEHGLNLYANGVKDELLTRGVMGMTNIQDYIPYGENTFMGRGNPVQWFNVYDINKESMDNLKALGISGDDLASTSAQHDYNQRNPNRRMGVNVKVGYMTQEALDKRLQELQANNAEARALLDDPIRKARLYEQQAVMTKEFMDSFKVTDSKYLDKDHGFIWSKEFAKDENLIKTTAKPGDILGWNHDGSQVRWEQQQQGRIFTKAGDARIGVETTNNPFKFMIEMEKATDGPSISRELMQEITGSDDIHMLYNPNITKHNDFGAMMTGQAKLIANHVLGLQGAERKKALKQVSQAGLGLTWKGSRFEVTTGQDVPAGAFDRLLGDLGIANKTSTGMDIGIQEVRLSHVQNYSRMTDETGKVVLGYDSNNNPIHGSYKGVAWGHREMRVLDNIGAEKTKEFMMNRIIENGTRTGRFDEVMNMAKAAASFVHNPSDIGITDRTFRPRDFSPVPEYDLRTTHNMSGTIFDRDHVAKMMGVSAEQAGHGFWLDLPDGGDKGYDFLESVHRDTPYSDPVATRTKINKIFIPFTQQETASGKVQFKDLQKHISDIYRRAAEVDTAKDERTASRARGKLQGAINKYTGQLTKDISASHGLAFEGLFKTDMANSGTGLFKLIDPKGSTKLGLDAGNTMDEFTVISEADAKKMGVFDQLKDIMDRRAAGETIDDMISMNTRYPTFHNDAQQLTKLRMNSSVKDGSFHVSAFTSDLMKADSDGDYNNIVAIQDKGVQEEWRRIYSQKQTERRLRQEAAIRNFEEDEAGRKFNLSEMNPDGTYKPYVANMPDELNAKAGKMIVGQASNLNFAMQQTAKQYLSGNQAAIDSIYKFGQDMEQKLISSKHGAKDLDLAMEFITGVYKARDNKESDWARLHELDKMFFADDHHASALSELRQVKNNIKGGMYNSSMRFGTSGGVKFSNNGMRGLVDQMLGEGEDVIRTNEGLNTWRRFLGSDFMPGGDSPNSFHADPFKQSMFRKATNIGGFAAMVGDLAHDATGGWIGEKGRKEVSSYMNDFWNGANKVRNRVGAAVGALALGGIMGYNTLKGNDVVAPYNLSSQDLSEPYGTPEPAMGPIESNGSSGANVRISAKGKGQNQNLAPAVEQGMRSSGHSGNTNMTVNYQDNTSKMSRAWYRDKVEEHI